MPLADLGQYLKLIVPAADTDLVKRGKKSDTGDVAAICEAAKVKT
jgi:hypothetical protein